MADLVEQIRIEAEAKTTKKTGEKMGSESYPNFSLLKDTHTHKGYKSSKTGKE
jgi:hypothetical protein